MKSIQLPFIVAALTIAVATCAYAQTPAKKSQPKSSATKPIEYSPPPLAEQKAPPPPPPFSPIYFNPSESVVAYLANEPQKVYAWIEAQSSNIPGKPDQYTTTEERQKYEVTLAEKMRAIQPIPIIGAC